MKHFLDINECVKFVGIVSRRFDPVVIFSCDTSFRDNNKNHWSLVSRRKLDQRVPAALLALRFAKDILIDRLLIQPGDEAVQVGLLKGLIKKQQRDTSKLYHGYEKDKSS